MKYLAGLIAVASLAFSGAAHAVTPVHWIDWNTTPGAFTTGATGGSASGTLIGSAVTVSYSGELENLFDNYPSWNPTSTYTGPTIPNGPPQSGGIVQLYGATGSTNTITFSQAVLNPVFAIWSLGQGGRPASFVFSLPFTIVAGGPSAEYAGAPITYTPTNTVSGVEGNGVIAFHGMVQSITFTNPQQENWYGFTAGYGAVPEPASWALMLMGFFGMGVGLRACRKSRTAALADA